MAVVKLEVKPMGILDMYVAIAVEMGVDPHSVKTYDCTRVYVAEDLFEAVGRYYGEDRKEAFGMDWVVCGPKVDKTLGSGEARLEDGFMTFKEVE